MRSDDDGPPQEISEALPHRAGAGARPHPRPPELREDGRRRRLRCRAAPGRGDGPHDAGGVRRPVRQGRGVREVITVLATLYGSTLVLLALGRVERMVTG